MIDDLCLKNFLADLETLVNTDSGQDCPEGLAKCMDFFDRQFRSMGWKTQQEDVGAAAPCFVAVNREAESYDFLLTGHLDTVFPKGTAAQRPYRSEGDIAYGPGVCDMKHGCLTILYALRNLNPEILKKKNIMVILQPDEEIGSRFSRQYICSLANRCRICMVFEAAEDEDGTPVRCIQRKGMIQFHFIFTGKAGHAGSLLTNGSVSAINEMSYWINRIVGIIDAQAGTTANIGLVSGGTASNVVAEKAEMKGEIRYEDPAEAVRAKEIIKSLFEHAKQNRVHIDQPLDRFEPPMVPSAESVKFAQELQAIAADMDMPFEVRKRGGLSAANFISTCLPVCIDGMGPRGNGAHSVNEYLCIDRIKDDIEFICKVLTKY